MCQPHKPFAGTVGMYQLTQGTPVPGPCQQFNNDVSFSDVFVGVKKEVQDASPVLHALRLKVKGIFLFLQ